MTTRKNKTKDFYDDPLEEGWGLIGGYRRTNLAKATHASATRAIGGKSDRQPPTSQRANKRRTGSKIKTTEALAKVKWVKNVGGLVRCANYISRHGDDEENPVLFDQLGRFDLSDTEQDSLGQHVKDNWLYQARRHGEYRSGMHIVFSTPNATPEQNLAIAVATTTAIFGENGHDFVGAVHMDDNGVDSHAHVLVNARSRTGSTIAELSREELKGIRYIQGQCAQALGLEVTTTLKSERLLDQIEEHGIENILRGDYVRRSSQSFNRFITGLNRGESAIVKNAPDWAASYGADYIERRDGGVGKYEILDPRRHNDVSNELRDVDATFANCFEHPVRARESFIALAGENEGNNIKQAIWALNNKPDLFGRILHDQKHLTSDDLQSVSHSTVARLLADHRPIYVDPDTQEAVKSFETSTELNRVRLVLKQALSECKIAKQKPMHREQADKARVLVLDALQHLDSQKPETNIEPEQVNIAQKDPELSANMNA